MAELADVDHGSESFAVSTSAEVWSDDDDADELPTCRTAARSASLREPTDDMVECRWPTRLASAAPDDTESESDPESEQAPRPSWPCPRWISDRESADAVDDQACESELEPEPEPEPELVSSMLRRARPALMLRDQRGRPLPTSDSRDMIDVTEAETEAELSGSSASVVPDGAGATAGEVAFLPATVPTPAPEAESELEAEAESELEAEVELALLPLELSALLDSSALVLLEL